MSNDEISRVVTKVMGETNSQVGHVASAAETVRASTQVVQDALARYPGGNGDREVKGELQTLSASLKAYEKWLGKAQNAAQSIHREVDALCKHVGCTEATLDRVEAASVGAFGKVKVLQVGPCRGDPEVASCITNAEGLYNALVLHDVVIGPEATAALKTKLRGVRSIALHECFCAAAIGGVLVDLLVKTDSISSLVDLTLAVARYVGGRPAPPVTITDQDLDSLSEAGVHLRVLRVPDQPVTTVAPFATTLVELDASGLYCGIGDAGLTSAHNIVKLHAENNGNITTAAPFATTLLELDASGSCCGMGDAGLASAHNIVKLVAGSNKRITTVAPFATTLMELDVSGGYSGIGDAGLTSALNIVKLLAKNNESITTVAPFAATLLELDVSGGYSGIGDKV
jgi:hypothetical protein